MWPGCGYKYQGKRVTFFGDFNKTWSMENRVDVSLSWFKHKKTPANLVFLYIDHPDSEGHIFGTESKVVSFIFFFPYYKSDLLCCDYAEYSLNVKDIEKFAFHLIGNNCLKFLFYS